jgi:hypothetical protein
MTQLLTTIALLGALTAAEGRAFVEKIAPRPQVPTLSAARVSTPLREMLGTHSQVIGQKYAIATDIRDKSKPFDDDTTSGSAGTGPKPPREDYDITICHWPSSIYERRPDAHIMMEKMTPKYDSRSIYTAQSKF